MSNYWMGKSSRTYSYQGIVFMLFFILSIPSLFAQKKTFKDCYSFKGYIKDMQMVSFADTAGSLVSDNFLHNRLNFRVFPHKNITLGVEVRNRFFWGETVSSFPGYGSFLATDLGYVDMSWLLMDNVDGIFLTQIDRAWMEWSNDNWEIRAGRQRINWGVNMFWNSNDLFNAYSLVDFDYEERPGTDALRIQRHLNNMGAIEIAVQPGKTDSTWVAAAMYKFNKKAYDIQILGGIWNSDYTLGMGWAGNIKNAGLKGEVTYFHPRESLVDTTGILSASISTDYVFKSGIFGSFGFLYQSQGMDEKLPMATNLFGGELSSKQLMPMKYSALISLSHSFSPIINASLVGIWSPILNSVFVMPSLGVSVSNSWEVALYGQTFWMETSEFENIGNGVFFRLKGSF